MDNSAGRKFRQKSALVISECRNTFWRLMGNTANSYHSAQVLKKADLKERRPACEIWRRLLYTWPLDGRIKVGRSGN
jgi:hypothetical protein